MTFAILTYPKFQAFNDDESFMVGGQLYAYEMGTSTAKTLYQDKDLLVPYTFPIVLDARGETTIWGSGQYKLVLDDINDDEVWSVDGVDLTAISNYSRSLLLLNTATEWRDALNLGTAATKDVGTSAGQVVMLDAVGLPAVDGSQLTGLTTSQLEDWEAPTIEPVFPRGHIDGLVMSRASATTITVSVGSCRNSDDTVNMVLGSSITKSLTSTSGTPVVWAVGTGQEGTEEGTYRATNTWYYVYLIKRVDTDVVDIVISDDPTTPTLPDDYTIFRRIGTFLTDATGSGEIIDFIQRNDRFEWKTTTTSESSAIATTESGTMTVSRIPAIDVIAFGLVRILNTATGTSTLVWISTNNIVSVADTPEAVGRSYLYTAFPNYLEIPIPSDSKLLFKTDGAITGNSVVVYFDLFGFIDPRGKDA